MISRLFFFFSVIALAASQNITELLGDIFPILNTVDLFDGPPSISHAPLPTPAKTKIPTLDQMMYYNYYAVSSYCTFELQNLDCFYCENFKEDVKYYKILKNTLQDTLALVTLSEKREEIVVTYRGTYNIWNFVLDFDFFNGQINNTSPIRIHKGFYIAAMSLYNDVVKAVGYLRSLKSAYSKYKIVIVGHSLGAAMARVTEYFLISLNQFPGAVYEVYGYGEPRSGNKYYADYLNNQTVTTARIIHRADVVPHVAPTSVLGTTLLLGDFYLHTGTEYWVTDDDEIFCSRSVYEDPTCSDSLGPLYYVVDHLTYFDANYATCAGGQPLELFEIPLPSDIPQPNEILPPLPEFISSFNGAAAGFIVNTLTNPFNINFI